MTNAADSLRKTGEPIEIFGMVLRSLESHRPAKAEEELLSAIQKEFALSAKRARWPDELVASNVSVDHFLKFTLGLIAPFVDMVIDLYQFLYEYVSTAGGRTEHFVIESEDRTKRWSFDTSRLPKQIQWISAWMDVAVEEVRIDWKTIGSSLISDNGIFYGSLDDIRLIQSLILARTRRMIHAETRELADRIYAQIKRALRAWYRGMLDESRERDGPLMLRAFVPSIARDFLERRVIRDDSRSLRIDLDVELYAEPGSYTAEEVLRGPEIGTEAVISETVKYEIESAGFFCALWGLEDSSFERMASLLGSHETKRDLLLGSELATRGLTLGERVLKRIEDAIESTGNVSYVRDLVKRQLEILLLPYWKDRWFLFEVWTLVQVLRRGRHIGASLELREVTVATEENLRGDVWHLPTQKAKRPVAALSSDSATVLVWFQRETPRRDSAKQMEPDVRVTRDATPFADVAIVECKDRLRFAGSNADRVVQTYVSGADARLVWLVNYEGKRSVRVEESVEQTYGVITGFRPNAIPPSFRATLDGLLRKELRLEAAPPEAEEGGEYLIIDISASMAGQELASQEVVTRFLSTRIDRVKLWTNTVLPAEGNVQRELVGPRLLVRGTGAENKEALVAYARELPQDIKLILITDPSGWRDFLRHRDVQLDKEVTDCEYFMSIASHPLRVILVGSK